MTPLPWLLALACARGAVAERVDLTPVLPPGVYALEVRSARATRGSEEVLTLDYTWRVVEGGRPGEDPLAMTITLDRVRQRVVRDGQPALELDSEGPAPARARHLALLAPAGLSWSLRLAPGERPRVEGDRSPLDARLARAGVDAVQARSLRQQWAPEAALERLRGQLLDLPGGRRLPGEVWQAPPGPDQLPFGPHGDPAGVRWRLDAVEDGLAALSGHYPLPETESLTGARCELVLVSRPGGPPQRFMSSCQGVRQPEGDPLREDLTFTWSLR